MSKYSSLARRIRTRLAVDLSSVTGLSLSVPSFVCAKMTMRCNSRCVHCDIWDTDYEEVELATEQWKKTLDDLRRWLGKFTMIFTGGEALLRPDMPEILEHAAGIGIAVELLTNGIAVDDRLAERVVRAGVTGVTLSFDGIKPGTHDRFRGKDGFYEKTASAVASFARHRDRLNPRMNILLKTVISSNNLSELADIARFAQAGRRHIRYQPIEQNYGVENDPKWYLNSPLWVKDVPLLEEQIGKLKELKAAGALIDNSPDELDSYVSYFENPDEMMAAVKAHDIRRWNKSCRAALGSFVISGNGDVRMCYMMEPIGNVSRTVPKDIWAGRKRCWTSPCGYR